MTGFSAVRFGAALGLLCVAAPSMASAKDTRAAHIRAHYTKYEYRIAMRDGVRLFTSVYLPNDRSKRYPILMQRTPYRVAPYGADRYKRELGPSSAFETKGYIFVFQDVRGCFMSQGSFVNMRPQAKGKRGARGLMEVDESTDTHDTIVWLLKHLDGHNGKVGLRGISYPGFYAAAGAINGHPALKAVCPQAPIADWYWDDIHHNGAFILSLGFNFLAFFGHKRSGLGTDWPERFVFGTPDGYQFFHDLGPLSNVDRRYFKGKIPFWRSIVEHPNYDEFWRSRNILPHLKGIKAAVLVVGGWYDAEDLYGPLNIHRAIERQNRRVDSRLVMGPWSHGGWERSRGATLGDKRFGFATSKYYQDKIELPFFEQHLRGEGKHKLPRALMFETGANRWRRFSRWPPRHETRKLYLRSEERLSFHPPNIPGAPHHDAYISDPNKPVPYTMKISTRLASDFMGEDQRFAAWRPDVMVYATNALKDDLTVAGPMEANLFVSTTAGDADWVVKLIDVHPGRLAGKGKRHTWSRGGQQLLVRGEIMRGRFRESFSQPKPFTPRKVTRVSFRLPDVLHTFKRGHRVMVQIQSSWFPFADRNPQRYVPNIFKAKASDFIRATHRVYRSKEYPSHLVIGTL